MGKSRNRKDHKKRVAARNMKIQAEKAKTKKIMIETLEKLKQQQSEGYYSNPGIGLPLPPDETPGYEIIQ